ncbi:MAG: hypothetical protein LBG58_14830, partial [Planctomycetaceae bacterium]|nr:hypothetical protein [Planctomycetaceae bacterium]
IDRWRLFHQHFVPTGRAFLIDLAFYQYVVPTGQSKEPTGQNKEHSPQRNRYDLFSVRQDVPYRLRRQRCFRVNVYFIVSIQ